MAARPGPGRPAEAVAFAPGHVTAVFRPDLSARDPRGRGSVGAGFTLSAGAWARLRWRPGSVRRITVRGDGPGPFPITAEVASRMLGDRSGTLHVETRHELPVGQGFGMSAAGALATALAGARLFRRPRVTAVEVAHLADLFGGGGLGGVSSILAGGIELRQSPGIPPWGRVLHRRWTGALFVSVAGRAIPSPAILGDPRWHRRIERASAGALGRLGNRPTAASIAEEGERFTDRLGLAPAALRSRLRALRRSGSPVFQAMFGTALVAVPRTRAEEVRLLDALRSADLVALRLGAAAGGAAAVDPRSWGGVAPEAREQSL